MIHSTPGHAGGQSFGSPLEPLSHSDSAVHDDPHCTIVGDFRSEPLRIGPYRIVRLIAAGAMGKVYCAFNEATKETVALKLVDSTSEKDRTFFLREMSILSRLHHPRIVSIRDFGSIDGQLFMAMEHVSTIDFRQELMLCSTTQQARLVCGIGCYILSGLAHAHAQNIVHRDIKPANLLVYRNSNRENKIGVKICDFGMSKDTRDAGLSGMTCEGEIRGTPAFMAPEHFRSSRDAGPASDIYSTAAVLYFFLSGMIPHQETEGCPVTLSRMIEGKPISIASHRHDLPRRLCHVIDRGLASVESGRYQTAIEFNQALLEFTRKEGR